MAKIVEAVYENGVLRPLDPLPLREHQKVTISICELIGSADSLSDLLVPSTEWPEPESPPSHEDVRRALSTIPGSLADTIIEERRERW